MDNVDKMNLVKQTLEKRGVSQTKLAELLGVNLTTVNNWFRRGSIPDKYLDNISMLFNLKISQHTSLEDTVSSNQTNHISSLDSGSYGTSVAINHIDTNVHKIFHIDKSIIGLKELDNIRFNMIQSARQNVDIIDIDVDIYCGDGIYYVKYPHGLLAKRIKYNLNNTYTVIDCNDSTSALEVLDFSGKLAGKVIVRIEVF